MCDPGGSTASPAADGDLSRGRERVGALRLRSSRVYRPGWSHQGASLGRCRILAQQPMAVLGNQAGEARTRELTAAGGFGRFLRAAEAPFNLVYEVRP